MYDYSSEIWWRLQQIIEIALTFLSGNIFLQSLPWHAQMPVLTHTVARAHGWVRATELFISLYVWKYWTRPEVCLSIHSPAVGQSSTQNVNQKSNNDILSSSQCGFRPGASTEHALLKFTANIIKCFDNKNVAINCYLHGSQQGIWLCKAWYIINFTKEIWC